MPRRKNSKRVQKHENTLVWSAVSFMFGSFVILFGIDLHNSYKFGSSYNNALHLHYPAGLSIIAGGVIAFLGLVGMIGAISSKGK